MKSRIIFIISLLVISLTQLTAEVYEFTHHYDARAVGMANIFCPTEDNTSAIFYNAAGLGQIRGTIFNCMYANIHSLGMIKNYVLSTAKKNNDNIGVGLGWVYERVVLEPEIWQQHRFLYGVSWYFMRQIYFSLTPKIIYINTDLQNYNKIWGYGTDGAFLILSKNWDINFLDNHDILIKTGASFKNIYSLIKWNDKYKETKFLDLIWWTVGINFKNSFDLLFQIRSIKTSISSISAGMQLSLMQNSEVNFSSKYKINDIILRCGIDYNRAILRQITYSAGMGLIMELYSLNYAYQYQSNYFPSTHYFSLTVRN